MADPIRLVFMGSDPVGLPVLDWLAGEGGRVARLEAIFTGPDKPSGRGQSVRPNAVKSWVGERPVRVFQPERLGEGELESLRSLEADLVLVVAYGQILRESFIGAPRLGTVNLHASILPRLRGASPIQTAVALGEVETGMSLMRIVRELDAGPVADVERVPIGPRDTAAEVEGRLARAAVTLLDRSLPELVAGRLVFKAQDPAAASFCRRLAKSDGVLDFSQGAAALAARVNGMNPWPSVTAEFGASQVRFGLAEALPEVCPLPAGTVIGADGTGLRVATGSGTLRVLRLQRPGGRMLSAPEFLRGQSIPAGSVFKSAAMPPLSAASPFRR